MPTAFHHVRSKREKLVLQLRRESPTHLKHARDEEKCIEWLRDDRRGLAHVCSALARMVIVYHCVKLQVFHTKMCRY